MFINDRGRDKPTLLELFDYIMYEPEMSAEPNAPSTSVAIGQNVEQVTRHRYDDEVLPDVRAY